MANIAPKRRSVIQAGTNYAYNPATFMKEHFEPNFHVVDSADEMLSKIKPFEWRERKLIVFDTETHASGLKATQLPANVVRRWVGKGKEAHPQDFPFCLSICDGVNAYSLYDNLDNGYAEFKQMRELFEDREVDKVAHNAKFDMHMLANIGMKIRGRIHDTVVLAKLANENRLSFALMDLAAKLPLGVVKYEYMVDAYKKAHKIADYRHIPKELLTYYADADVWNCFQEFTTEFPKLEKDELIPLYNNELELMIALWAMERYGMRTDSAYEEPLKHDLQVVTDEAEAAIYEETGSFFNINSGKQLYEALLRTGVDRDLIKMSDKGNPVLDKKALDGLAERHEVSVVKKILEYRKNEKLLNTYAVGIYAQRDENGKVHGSVNQTEATTGRMSITKPALQTLPKKDKRIRTAFIPSEGFELWFMDLDQIEYRGLAHYAKAEGLIKAIINGQDIHSATAAALYNVPYEEVTDEQRTKAKTVNFSFVYGQGDDAAAAALKMNKSQARRFKELYFAQIPEVQPFIEMVHKVVKVRGFLKNFYGRRRRLTADEAYKGPNALIQGWAADYIKSKTVDTFKFLMAHDYKTRLINVVHDELLDEIHQDELFLVPKLRWLLSDFETYRVPITAGVDRGDPSWGQKVSITDCGFAPLTDEERATVAAYDIFDGGVFDKVRQ